MPSMRGDPYTLARKVRRRDVLGGLIHEHAPLAA
jgi:hypothetical protein